jgi:hypothetical protein
MSRANSSLYLNLFPLCRTTGHFSRTTSEPLNYATGPHTHRAATRCSIAAFWHADIAALAYTTATAAGASAAGLV